MVQKEWVEVKSYSWTPKMTLGLIMLIAMLVSAVILIVLVFITIRNSGDEVSKCKAKTITIQPDIKDTSSYHWVDEFTDAQLREMCKDGTLKLK